MPESEYEVELFRKQGFTRQTCPKCSTPFWSLGIHETCGEAPCQEYDFIGASPFKKKLTYRAMREDFLSFLEQNGHTRVKPCFRKSSTSYSLSGIFGLRTNGRA